MNYNNQQDESTSSEHYETESYEVQQVRENISKYNLEEIIAEHEIDKEIAIKSIAVNMHKFVGGDFEKILSEVNNQLQNISDPEAEVYADVMSQRN